MAEKGSLVEIPALRNGLQAFYIESREAKRFGLKDPMAEVPKMIRQINNKLLELGASYKCSTPITGSTGGFVGLIVVVESNPDAERDGQGNYELGPGLNVIAINSEEAEKFGLKEIGIELTGKVDQIVGRLPKGANIVDINSVPSSGDGTTIGIVMVVDNS